MNVFPGKMIVPSGRRVQTLGAPTHVPVSMDLWTQNHKGLGEPVKVASHSVVLLHSLQDNYGPVSKTKYASACIIEGCQHKNKANMTPELLVLIVLVQAIQIIILECFITENNKIIWMITFCFH